MPAQGSYNLYPLLAEASINENTRPGTLLLEYFDVVAAIDTLEETLELATQLDNVLGLIDLNFKTTGGDPTDAIHVHTDGVITTGAVTIDIVCTDIGNGNIHVRGFLIGTKRTETALINSPA